MCGHSEGSRTTWHFSYRAAFDDLALAQESTAQTVRAVRKRNAARSNERQATERLSRPEHSRVDGVDFRQCLFVRHQREADFLQVEWFRQSPTLCRALQAHAFLGAAGAHLLLLWDLGLLGKPEHIVPRAA